MQIDPAGLGTRIMPGVGLPMPAAVTTGGALPMLPTADRPIAADATGETAAVPYSDRLMPALSADDGEELESVRAQPVQQVLSGDPLTPSLQQPIVPVNNDMPVTTKRPAVAAAPRRIPVREVDVQVHSWDGAARPLSTDDGEPLPVQRPQTQPAKPPPRPEPAPAPARSDPALPRALVQFEYVTRGMPPPPPKDVSLRAPRFVWTKGRLECTSTPHPTLLLHGTVHDDVSRSHVPLQWPGTAASSILPPSYDTARRTLGGEFYLGEEAKPGELELQGVPADAEPHGLSLAAASLGGLGLWRSSSGWWDETREEQKPKT